MHTVMRKRLHLKKSSTVPKKTHILLSPETQLQVQQLRKNHRITQQKKLSSRDDY